VLLRVLDVENVGGDFIHLCNVGVGAKENSLVCILVC